MAAAALSNKNMPVVFDDEIAPKKNLVPVQKTQLDPSSFDTKLSPEEEVSFQEWKSKYAPNDSGADYDLRGAFKAGLSPDPQTGHWADTFKKPNHPTFSNQSQYATGENAKLAGTWEGDQFVPPGSTPVKKSRVVFDDEVPEKPKDAYEIAQQNLKNIESDPERLASISREDFLKPASEGGTLEYWQDPARRYGQKIKGLADVGKIGQAAVGTVKELTGQTIEAGKEFLKNPTGSGIAATTGALAGAGIRFPQFATGLIGDVADIAAQNLPEALVGKKGRFEGASELQRMKMRAVSEQLINTLKNATTSEKTLGGGKAAFDVGAFLGEQVPSGLIPTVGAVAPGTLEKATELAIKSTAIPSKVLGTGLKASGAVLKNPAVQFAAEAATFGLPTATADLIGAGVLPQVRGGLKRIVFGEAGNALAASGDILTSKPVGKSFASHIRDIAPSKIANLDQKIALSAAAPRAEGWYSVPANIVRGLDDVIMNNKKRAWEKLESLSNSGLANAEEAVRRQMRREIGSLVNVGANVTQAGLIGASGQSAADDDALAKSFGGALGFVAPLSALGSKTFNKNIEANRLAKVGEKIRYGDSALDAMSQAGEKALSPSMSKELYKLKAQLSGAATPEGAPIEVYALEPQAYADYMRKNYENAPSDVETTRGYFDAQNGRLLVKADPQTFSDALLHEGGHAFETAIRGSQMDLQDTLGNQLLMDFQKNPKSWETFREAYQKRLGSDISDNQMFTEAKAELGRAILEGQGIEGLGFPKPVTTMIGNAVTKALETMGFKGSKSKTGGEFGVPMAKEAIDTYSKNMRDFANASRPAIQNQNPVESFAQKMQEADASYLAKVQGNKKAGTLYFRPSQQFQNTIAKIPDTYSRNLQGTQSYLKSLFEVEKPRVEPELVEIWKNLNAKEKRLVAEGLVKEPIGEITEKATTPTLPGEEVPILQAEQVEPTVLPIAETKPLEPIQATPEQASTTPQEPVLQIQETTLAPNQGNIRVQEGEGLKANIAPLSSKQSAGLKEVYPRRFDKETQTVIRAEKPKLKATSFDRSNQNELDILSEAASNSPSPENFNKSIDSLEQAIAGRQGLSISYESAKNEQASSPLAVDRGEAQSLANLGLADRETVQKNIIPQSFEYLEKSEPIMNQNGLTQAKEAIQVYFEKAAKNKRMKPKFESAQDAKKAAEDLVNSFEKGEKLKGDYTPAQVKQVMELFPSKAVKRIYVEGYSPDKVASNAKNLMEALDNSKLTQDATFKKLYDYLKSGNWQADLKARNQNMAEGYRGDGKIFFGPEGQDINANIRNTNYNPVQIDDFKVQALNLIEGGSAQTYFPEAQANMATTPRAIDLPKELPNPLEQKLYDIGEALKAKRGEEEVSGLQKIIEPASETIRVDRIKSIKGASNINLQPSFYAQRASGFLPKASDLEAPRFARPPISAPVLERIGRAAPSMLGAPKLMPLRKSEEN